MQTLHLLVVTSELSSRKWENWDTVTKCPENALEFAKL
jgi:hypothetical protein